MRPTSLVLVVFLTCFPFSCKSKFWRRRWHSSVVARNWLYIDGGEVSFTQGNYVRQNSTIGIDLSKDWTNASLTLINIERPPKLYSRSSQALWHDGGRNIVYSFGGDNPGSEPDQFAPAPTDSVQGFTPNDDGGGQWKEVLGFVGEKPFPSNIHGTSSGMFTSDEKNAYYAGGFMSKNTSPSGPTEFQLNSGLLRLDFETLTLTNSTSPALSFLNSVLLNVPVYGSEGVLVAFGGSDDRSDGMAVGLNVINVFDKKEQKWYQQFAEGDIPRPRVLFCAVGVHGKENTSFEIIIHGGIVDLRMGPEGEKFDQVYVLSLPAFRWFRANSTTTFPRMAHTCHATETRQMIMIGGTNPLFSGDYNVNGDKGGEPQDPWDQGIGVFDMTALKFKDSYQSSTEPYEAPYAIQQYYNNSDSKYPSQWTSSAVKQLFQTQPLQIIPNTTNTANTANPTIGTRSSTTSASPSLAFQRSRSHLSHGALAGLIVGCIVASLLSGVIIIYIQKRRKKEKKRHAEIPVEGAATPQATFNQQTYSEMSTEREPKEIMNARSDRAELSDSCIKPPVELDTSHRASTLNIFTRS